MDTPESRSILLKVQDCLRDSERERLHLYSADDVSLRIRDEPSLGGTFSQMESLFEQDKVNELDVTVLVQGFTAIEGEI